MKKILALAVALSATSPATAESIAQCRAHSRAREAAGMCGAHGCDCGMTVKECQTARAEIRECIELGMAGGGMRCVRLINECKKGNK